LKEFLESHGIESNIHYPVPVHQQKPFVDLRIDPKGLINTEDHSRNCLSLPCHPQLNDLEVDEVISVINNY